MNPDSYLAPKEQRLLESLIAAQTADPRTLVPSIIDRMDPDFRQTYFAEHPEAEPLALDYEAVAMVECFKRLPTDQMQWALDDLYERSVDLFQSLQGCRSLAQIEAAGAPSADGFTQALHGLTMRSTLPLGQVDTAAHQQTQTGLFAQQTSDEKSITAERVPKFGEKSFYKKVVNAYLQNQALPEIEYDLGRDALPAVYFAGLPEGAVQLNRKSTLMENAPIASLDPARLENYYTTIRVNAPGAYETEIGWATRGMPTRHLLVRSTRQDYGLVHVCDQLVQTKNTAVQEKVRRTLDVGLRMPLIAGYVVRESLKDARLMRVEKEDPETLHHVRFFDFD